MFWWWKNPWDLIQQLWTNQMLQTVSIHSPLAHSSNNKLDMGKIHFISGCNWTSKHQSLRLSNKLVCTKRITKYHWIYHEAVG
jgi:hypothetical protein